LGETKSLIIAPKIWPVKRKIHISKKKFDIHEKHSIIRPTTKRRKGKKLKIEEKRGSIVRKPKSTKNYINGPDFYRSLVAYNEALDAAGDGPRPIIPKYIGECIIKLATNLSNKFNFTNYSFKEEMVLDAIEKMIEKVEKFDVNYNKENPNPFAYFSQTAWNVFLQRIAKEKKEQYIKHKNFERSFMNEFGGDEMFDAFNNDDHNKVINEFEAVKSKENNYATHKNLDYSKNRKKHNENKDLKENIL